MQFRDKTQNKRQMMCVAAAAQAGCGGPFATSGEAPFAHRDKRLPLRAVMASGGLAKATGAKISRRMFGAGANLLRAMAPGDVQIGAERIGLAAHRRRRRDG